MDDVGQHAKLAGRERTYLAYCLCRRGEERRQIVAAFTAGDVDDLFVGRNGIFYDPKGQDWDATITQVIENAIIIRQAFFLPYKKFLRMIEEPVAKRAADSDKQSEGMLATLATRGAAAETGTAPAPAPAAKTGLRRLDVGTVAVLAVSLGSISAVPVGVFAQFVRLGAWVPVALLTIVLAISGPSILIARLKLCPRSLGPFLDASVGHQRAHAHQHAAWTHAYAARPDSRGCGAPVTRPVSQEHHPLLRRCAVVAYRRGAVVGLAHAVVRGLVAGGLAWRLPSPSRRARGVGR